jgi:hypothetical protein
MGVSTVLPNSLPPSLDYTRGALSDGEQGRASAPDYAAQQLQWQQHQQQLLLEQEREKQEQQEREKQERTRKLQEERERQAAKEAATKAEAERQQLQHETQESLLRQQVLTAECAKMEVVVLEAEANTHPLHSHDSPDPHTPRKTQTISILLPTYTTSTLV